jgi:hypothetical protein
MARAPSSANSAATPTASCAAGSPGSSSNTRSKVDRASADLPPCRRANPRYHPTRQSNGSFASTADSRTSASSRDFNSIKGRYGVAEGVVVKCGSGGADLWMAKIKTYAYLERLRQAFRERWEDYWE